MALEACPHVKFELIKKALDSGKNMLSVTCLCDIAGVSRSGYYTWLAAAPIRERREEKDRSDFELILVAYQFRGYSKGARGVHMRLLHTGTVMNVKKIRRLMRKYNLRCPIRKANPYRRMAKAMKTSHVAPNLLQRAFTAYGPRMVLLTDITYILYGCGEKCYLCTILDAYTKQILSYVVSDSLEVDFVLETVNILIRDHGVSLQAQALINSDQGCHYTSCKFIQIVKDNELRQSMSRRANCWDNAPQESFYGHLKDSIDLNGCEAYEQVVTSIDGYMDYYNNDRYQWNLAKLSPNEYWTYLNTGRYPLPIRPDREEPWLCRLDGDSVHECCDSKA